MSNDKLQGILFESIFRLIEILTEFQALYAVRNPLRTGEFYPRELSMRSVAERHRSVASGGRPDAEKPI